MVDDYVGHDIGLGGERGNVIPRAKASIDLRVIDRIEPGVGAIDRVKERQHVHASKRTVKSAVEQELQIAHRPARETIDVRDQVRLILHCSPEGYHPEPEGGLA
jgi:hypothetical protein